MRISYRPIAPAREPPKRSAGRWAIAVGLSLVAVVLAVLTAVLVTRGNSSSPAAAKEAKIDATMASATRRAAGLEAELATVDLGHVPMSTGCGFTYKLRNTGDAPITVGRPRVEVLEGC
jgi:hypothetical protein